MKDSVVVCLLFAVACVFADGHDDDGVAVAMCTVHSYTGSEAEEIEGSVYFRKLETGIAVDIELEGFNTTNEHTLHGFHIHGNGDMAQGCRAAGGHFNPYGRDHGAPADEERHVGDLGNIEEDNEGHVNTRLIDISGLIEFEGENSIIGRGIVIHEGEDDLGRGGVDGSLTTGDAGGRLACCIIRAVDDEPTPGGSSVVSASVSLLVSSLMLAAWSR